MQRDARMTTHLQEQRTAQSTANTVMPTDTHMQEGLESSQGDLKVLSAHPTAVTCWCCVCVCVCVCVCAGVVGPCVTRRQELALHSVGG